MADNADIAAEITEDTIAAAVRQARTTLLAGTAGECAECEWWMPRLVEGRCGFCRDGRPRPPDWEPPPRPDAIVTVPPEEKPTMPAKSVQLPASADTAIAAVEALAAQDGISLGLAAAQLIERGIAAPIAAEPSAAEAEPRPMRERLFAAIDVVAGLAAEILNQPDASAALARAEQAEQHAVTLTEELSVQTERASAAIGKLDSLRAALAA